MRVCTSITSGVSGGSLHKAFEKSDMGSGGRVPVFGSVSCTAFCSEAFGSPGISLLGSETCFEHLHGVLPPSALEVVLLLVGLRKGRGVRWTV
jgi:hypothetical protein